MRRGSPRRYIGDLVGVVVCMRCPLPPLVYAIGLFIDLCGPLVYIYKFGKGRELACKVIFFTD